MVTNMKRLPEKSKMADLVLFSASEKVTFRKVTPTATTVNEKNSDKSHSSIGMFPHRFGRFLPSVTHLASEKLILPNFSMLRGVAVSVCFPEVRNRKQTESGLVWLNLRSIGERHLLGGRQGDAAAFH